MSIRGTRIGRTGLLVACVFAALTLAGCGAGGEVGGAFGGDDNEPPRVNAATYTGGAIYQFGADPLVDVEILNAPEDADFDRWAMFNNGTHRFLVVLKQGSATEVYQFGFNDAEDAFVLGHQIQGTAPITGAPSEANPASIAMLHDGADIRLYMRGTSDVSRLYQFAFNRSTGAYEYGFRSINVIDTTGLPGDADFSRWAMLHDGSIYRQYVGRAGSTDVMYQCGFDGSNYVYGYRSIPDLTIVGTPANSDPSNFAMAHDGSDFRHFQLTDE